MVVLASAYGLIDEPALDQEDLRRIRLELDALIEEIGPRDARGILELSHGQRHQVEQFMQWLQDAFGEDDDD